MPCKKHAPIMVEFSETQLTAESDVASDSESCDVMIKAENDTFAAGLSAGDIKLGGSFEDMSVAGAEASGDTLAVHLSGRPKMDYDVASVITDGQISVPASGLEGCRTPARVLVPCLTAPRITRERYIL